MRKSHSEHFSTAVPQKADIARRGWHGRKVPGTEVAHLFDHLVRDREQRRRHGEAERLRSRKVDDELELGRLLDAAPFTLT
jgi:hypothetical protein